MDGTITIDDPSPEIDIIGPKADIGGQINFTAAEEIDIDIDVESITNEDGLNLGDEENPLVSGTVTIETDYVLSPVTAHGNVSSVLINVTHDVLAPIIITGPEGDPTGGAAWGTVDIGGSVYADIEIQGKIDHFYVQDDIAPNATVTLDEVHTFGTPDEFDLSWDIELNSGVIYGNVTIENLEHTFYQMHVADSGVVDIALSPDAQSTTAYITGRTMFGTMNVAVPSMRVPRFRYSGDDSAIGGSISVSGNAAGIQADMAPGGSLNVSGWLGLVYAHYIEAGSSIMANGIGGVHVDHMLYSGSGGVVVTFDMNGSVVSHEPTGNGGVGIGGVLNGGISPGEPGEDDEWPDEASWGAWSVGDQSYPWYVPGQFHKIDFRFDTLSSLSHENQEVQEGLPGLLLSDDGELGVTIPALTDAGLLNFEDGSLPLKDIPYNLVFDSGAIEVYQVGPGGETQIGPDTPLMPDQTYQLKIRAADDAELGATELGMRWTGTPLRFPCSWVALDTATINVVKLDVEVEGATEADDYVMTDGIVKAELTLEGWDRPAEFEFPAGFESIRLSCEPDGGQVTFSQTDEPDSFASTLTLPLTEDGTPFYIEGETLGEATIVMTQAGASPLSGAGGADLEGQASQASHPGFSTSKLGVLEIKIEWLQSDGKGGWKRITEPNHHPKCGKAGVKHYPDATAPGGPWNDQLQVRITVSGFGPSTDPAMQNIYLKEFDPDDPSSNTSGDVVDGNILGGDNRGTRGKLADESGTLTMSSDGKQGVFTTMFSTSHQPGDNHRIGVTLADPSSFSVLDDDVVTPDDRQASASINPSAEAFRGCISPLLTIWRNLHYEIHTMNRPTYEENIWRATYTLPMVLDEGSHVYSVFVDFTGGPIPGADQFEDGYIRFTGTDIIGQDLVYRQMSPVAGGIEFRVPGGIDLGSFVHSGTCEIGDDDLDFLTFRDKTWGSRTPMEPEPGVSQFARLYGQAYVTIHDAKVTGPAGGVPFERNSPSSWHDTALYDELGIIKALNGSAQYRAVTIGNFFQYTGAEDGDPNYLGATGGITPWKSVSSEDKRVAVFWEPARELNFYKESFGLLVAHEVTHTIAGFNALHLLRHDTEGFFKPNAGPADNTIGAKTLDWIRDGF